MTFNRRALSIVVALLVLAGIIWVAWITLFRAVPAQAAAFNGQRAMADVEYQLSLGPRIPGSEAHTKAVDWMVAELEKAGWQVEVQETSLMGHPIRNVIAKWGQGKPWAVIGAHYDSRLVADQDPSPAKRSQPVPGANDGASGVAVLLEVARALPSHMQMIEMDGPRAGLPRANQVWLVFFDAEDNGDIPGWDWILGSRAFVASLKSKPDAAIVIDMIGDKNLDVYRELNSNPQLTDEIWGEAAELKYSDRIIPQGKYRMLDDHIPFKDAGIPAADMIDFDYPYWHTTEDTADKVSAESMKVIGDTLLAWLTDAGDN